jgi:hypothetical protein
MNSVVKFKLPPRPDRSALSDSIPLFFVGRSQSGFWVARESEGRSGGLFLFRRSAARFARKKSAPWGCATMFVEHLELGIPNQGSRIAEPIAKIMRVTKQRLPSLANFVAVVAAECRKLVSRILRAIAGQRRNRCHQEGTVPRRIRPDLETRRRSAGSAMIAGTGEIKGERT